MVLQLIAQKQTGGPTQVGQPGLHETQIVPQGFMTPIVQTVEEGECVMEPHGQHIKYYLQGSSDSPTDQHCTNTSTLAYVEIPCFDLEPNGSVDMQEFVDKIKSFIERKNIVNEDDKLQIMSQRLKGNAYDYYVAWRSYHYTNGKTATLFDALQNLKKLVYR